MDKPYKDTKFLHFDVILSVFNRQGRSLEDQILNHPVISKYMYIRVMCPPTVMLDVKQTQIYLYFQCLR